MPKRSEHQLRVEAFMRKAGQALPEHPAIPDEKVRILRARLILEEALETIAALGVSVRTTAHLCGVSLPEDTSGKTYTFDLEVDFDKTSKGFVISGEPNLVEVVDGCCDIIVVTTGTLSACGVADAGPQRLVDEANLAKFSEGGYRRADGKWMKPPDWKLPDLVGELVRQGKL